MIVRLLSAQCRQQIAFLHPKSPPFKSIQLRIINKTAGQHFKARHSLGTSSSQPFLTLHQYVQHIRTSFSKATCKKWSLRQSFKSYSSVPLIFTLSGLCIGSKVSSTLLSQDTFILRASCKAKSPFKRRIDDPNSTEENEGKKKPVFQWAIFFKLLWKDVFYVIGAILAAIGAAFLNIQIPLVLGELSNVVANYASSATNEVGNFLSDIRDPSLKLCVIYGLQGLLTFSYISLLSIVGENMAARMRLELFSSLLRQDIQFFDAHKTGELVDRLTSDVQDFKSSFKMTISQGLKAITQTIGCAASLFLISPKLTVIMMGVIPLVIIGGTGVGGMLRALSLDAQRQISESTAIADEALGNVRTVRAFAMEDKELELYEDQVNRSRISSINLGIGIGAFQGASNIFLNGIVLGSLYAGGWLISNNEIKSGDLISFLVATQMIERSLAQLSLLLGHIIRGMSAGARVFEYVTSKSEVPLKGGVKIPFHSLFGNIKFSNVMFHYPTRPEQEILTDFNLDIPGGKMVALVGLSGGGKSTIAALLERFYDVNSGTISIDDVDIKELDPSWLRGKAIGFINQEPVLFATSVMENIRYGRPEASDNEVFEAAKMANADDFIRSFPNGYNTVLGERGVTVSGGQKQRIAIARAMIKNPSILILDEATSALDAESEHIVQEALDNAIKGRTVLVIAHRLSTIRNADMIAVVAHGKIVEIGTHSELKSLNGVYWSLVKKQELEENLSN